MCCGGVELGDILLHGQIFDCGMGRGVVRAKPFIAANVHFNSLTLTYYPPKHPKLWGTWVIYARCWVCKPIFYFLLFSEGNNINNTISEVKWGPLEEACRMCHCSILDMDIKQCRVVLRLFFASQLSNVWGLSSSSRPQAISCFAYIRVLQCPQVLVLKNHYMMLFLLMLFLLTWQQLFSYWFRS